MRLMTTTTAIPITGKSTSDSRRATTARLIGLAIASLVPAVFWSAIIELVSLWLGAPISPLKIAIVCGSIALFLLAICAPLMLREQASQLEARAHDQPTIR